MKNKDTIKNIVIVVLILVIVIGGSFLASEFNGGKANTARTTEGSTTSDSDIPEDEQQAPTEIDIDKYLALKEGSDLSIIYIARPTCSYCQKQKPIIYHLIYQYQLPVNYLNTDELDEEGFEKLTNSDEYFSSQWGTPLILIVQNGNIVDKAPGYHEEQELITFFQNNGFINQ